MCGVAGWAAVEPYALQILALACTAAALLIGGLAGVWLGFRIVTRDASLLARFASDAREARALASDAVSNGVKLREEWETAFDQIERKRASAAAAASKAEARSKVASAEEPSPPPPPLSGKERRRLLQRHLNGGGRGPQHAS